MGAQFWKPYSVACAQATQMPPVGKTQVSQALAVLGWVPKCTARRTRKARRTNLIFKYWTEVFMSVSSLVRRVRCERGSTVEGFAFNPLREDKGFIVLLEQIVNKENFHRSG
jgi:hypothetical protein